MMNTYTVLTRYPRLDHIAEFLAAWGAQDVRHSGRTLFEHLVGTASHLVAAGAQEDVVYAGLCHSIYGTPFFSRHLLRAEDRALMQTAIGVGAEELVWKYSTFVPDKIVTGTDLRIYEPLMQIAIANRMDTLQATGPSRETAE